MAKKKTQKLHITDVALEKIAEFAKAEKKTGHGLKIKAKNNEGFEPDYEMDFLEKPDKNDEILTFGKGKTAIKNYLDAESAINLEGSKVDFLNTAQGSGFKINNPAFPEGCTGGCEGCGMCY